MSDSNTNSLDIDPEVLRKLLQDINGAYELVQTNEQLRLELIETKRKLDNQQVTITLGLDLGRWFVGYGQVYYSDDENVATLKYGNNELIHYVPNSARDDGLFQFVVCKRKWFPNGEWVEVYSEVVNG